MVIKDDIIINFLGNCKISDSLNIFMSLRKECLGVVDPPIILEHQLLLDDGSKSSLQDLEMLVRDGEIRKLLVSKLELRTTRNCTGYCLKEDILNSIRNKVIEGLLIDDNVLGCNIDCLLNKKRSKEYLTELLNIVKNTIFLNYKSVNINYKELIDKLQISITLIKNKQEFCNEHFKLFDQDFVVTTLIRCGILRRQGGSDFQNLIFTTPSMGLFVKFLESGNNAIISALKRCRYKELQEDKLYSLKLGKSQFSLNFHLRDLQGTGIIKSM